MERAKLSPVVWGWIGDDPGGLDESPGAARDEFGIARPGADAVKSAGGCCGSFSMCRYRSSVDAVAVAEALPETGAAALPAATAVALPVPVETDAAAVTDVALMSCARPLPGFLMSPSRLPLALIQCQRVTGISGRQPWNPPTGSACCMESLSEVAAVLLPVSQPECFRSRW